MPDNDNPEATKLTREQLEILIAMLDREAAAIANRKADKDALSIGSDPRNIQVNQGNTKANLTRSERLANLREEESDRRAEIAVLRNQIRKEHSTNRNRDYMVPAWVVHTVAILVSAVVGATLLWLSINPRLTEPSQPRNATAAQTATLNTAPAVASQGDLNTLRLQVDQVSKVIGATQAQIEVLTKIVNNHVTHNQPDL